MIDRRAFVNLLGAGAAGLYVAGCASASDESSEEAPVPTSLVERVGLGLFSIPHLLEEDFEGTVRLLADIGYKEIEIYGPYPFSVSAAQEMWAAITPQLGFSVSGYYGMEPASLRSLLDDAGLSVPSLHIDLGTLRERIDETAETVQMLGAGYAGIAAIPEEERATLDDYRRLADEFNEIGRRAVERGFRFLYHNHGYGLQEVDGAIPMHILLERLDPSVVALEMDIYWTVAGGADPVEYLQNWPDHYRLMHLKDMTERVRFEGNGDNPQEWMELFPFMASPGAGVLDIAAIVAEAKTAGVEHFYVERDLAPDPVNMLQTSFDFLNALQG